MKKEPYHTIELVEIVVKGCKEVVELRFFRSKPEATEPSKSHLVPQGGGKIRTLPKYWPHMMGRGLEGGDSVGVEDDGDVVGVI
jgi:hypothetical protein